MKREVRAACLGFVAAILLSACPNLPSFLDDTAPVITLLGSATIYVDQGDTFTDPGATALDDQDGDISANIVVGGDTVDTATPGTYTITYNVSDSSGNAAIEAARTVVVEIAGGGGYRLVKVSLFDGSGGPDVYNTYEYDSSGKITLVSEFDSGGATGDYSSWEYDSGGNLTTKWEYEEGVLHSFTTYQRDSGGKPIQKSDFGVDAVLPGGSIEYSLDGYWTYEYGPDGSITKALEFDGDSNWVGYGVPQRDPDGNPARYSFYSVDDDLLGYYAYEYDAAPRMVEFSAYSAGDVLQQRCVLEYDLSGNLSMYSVFDPAGVLSHYGVCEWIPGSMSFPTTGFPSNMDLYFLLTGF